MYIPELFREVTSAIKIYFRMLIRHSNSQLPCFIKLQLYLGNRLYHKKKEKMYGITGSESHDY